jgi:hypothetical protein
MLTGFPFSDEWQSRSMVKGLFSAAHWNRYVSNWSVALDALRQLWKMGKVSELKTPFYEPFEKPASK